MINVTVAELMRAHVMCNLGIYFDQVDDVGADGLHLATSDTIRDVYWNFAYYDDGRRITDNDLAELDEVAIHSAQRPGIWQLEDSPRPSNSTLVSREVWMTCVAGDLRPATADQLIQVTVRDQPSSAMRKVFDDAYSSASETDDVGYFELPTEYGDAYMAGSARPPAKSFAVELAIDGMVVAISSGATYGAIAGIYSVGTGHKWRRRGLGRLASLECARVAISRGAELIFLQTEADSAVESMYSSLGFSRAFVGCLYSGEGD